MLIWARFLLTALAVGKPLCAGIFSASAVRPYFKGGGVCILFQYGADLRIVVAARQPYYAKLLAAQLYDIADGEAGLLDGFSAIGEGDGIFDKVYSIVLFRIFPLSVFRTFSFAF